jgi:hypothetical protein
MPRFNFAYAHDISCYAEFSIEADTLEQATEKANEQMLNNAFMQVPTEPDWNSYNQDTERVFHMESPTDRHFDDISTLENIELFTPSDDGVVPPTPTKPTPNEIR